MTLLSFVTFEKWVNCLGSREKLSRSFGSLAEKLPHLALREDCIIKQLVYNFEHYTIRCMLKNVKFFCVW